MRKRWVVFSLASLLFVLSQFYRVANAVIAPSLQRDLALTAQQLGLLSAVFFYAFAFVQIPLGMAIDRFGGRLTMAVLTAGGAGGALIFAGATSFPVALLGRGLLGFGMAGNLMGSMKLFSQWFSPREFATLSGMMLALGTLGNILAATPLAVANEAIGWRGSFVIAGTVTFLLAAVFFFCVEEHPSGAQVPPAPPTGAGFWPGLRTLYASRNYWIISAATFFRYGTLVAIQGLWIGPYMIQQLGLSPITAGNLLCALNIGLVLGSPLGGWLSDRALRSRKKVVLLGLSMMAVDLFGLALGWAGKSLWILGGLLFSFGLFGSFGIVMYAHIKELMPAHMTGSALTGINLFTMLGGAALLQGLGWMLDHGWARNPAGHPDYHMLFVLCALGVGAAMVAYSFVKDSS